MNHHVNQTGEKLVSARCIACRYTQHICEKNNKPIQEVSDLGNTPLWQRRTEQEFAAVDHTDQLVTRHPIQIHAQQLRNCQIPRYHHDPNITDPILKISNA